MTFAHMWWFDGTWDGPGIFWSVVMFVGTIAFWLIVGIMIIRLVRGRPAAGHPGSAMQVLEERYARGEIDRDEFVERRRVLRGDGP